MSKEVTYKLACFYYLHQRGGEKICLNSIVRIVVAGSLNPSATRTYVQVRISTRKSAANVVVLDVALSLPWSAVPRVQSVTAREL